jgi:hypothetical protein
VAVVRIVLVTASESVVKTVLVTCPVTVSVVGKRAVVKAVTVLVTLKVVGGNREVVKAVTVLVTVTVVWLPPTGGLLVGAKLPQKPKSA